MLRFLPPMKIVDGQYYTIIAGRYQGITARAEEPLCGHGVFLKSKLFGADRNSERIAFSETEHYLREATADEIQGYLRLHGPRDK